MSAVSTRTKEIHDFVEGITVPIPINHKPGFGMRILSSLLLARGLGLAGRYSEEEKANVARHAHLYSHAHGSCLKFVKAQLFSASGSVDGSRVGTASNVCEGFEQSHNIVRILFLQ